MAGNVKPIPDGFHSITPYLVVKNAVAAIDFYKRAFGAEELTCSMDERNNRVMNAKIRIGDSIIMLNDEYPEYGALGPSGDAKTPVTIHLYVEDVDTVFKQAIEAGAETTMPVTDMFWGDRFGTLKDPFGHHWSVATHIEDPTEAEIKERAKHAFA